MNAIQSNRTPNACMLTIAGIVTALVTWPAAAKADKTYVCRGVTVATRDKMSSTARITAYMRSATVYHVEIAGQGRTQIAIRNGPDLWVYLDGQRTSRHVREAGLGPVPVRLPVGAESDGIIKQGARLTGHENVGGKLCDVYTLKGPTSALIKIWVMPQGRLTVRETFKMTVPGAGGTGAAGQMHTIGRTIDYNWEFNKPMAASLFVLPAGIKVTEVTQPTGTPGFRTHRAAPH